MGIDEPQETYSSSEHLFSDMNIAPGTKGRLKATPTPRPEKRAGTPPRSRGSRPSGSNQGSAGGRSSDGRGSDGRSAGASSSQAGGSSDGRTRQRRRRRSGEGS